MMKIIVLVDAANAEKIQRLSLGNGLATLIDGGAFNVFIDPEKPKARAPRHELLIPKAEGDAEV